MCLNPLSLVHESNQIVETDYQQKNKNLLFFSLLLVILCQPGSEYLTATPKQLNAKTQNPHYEQ